MQVDLEHDRFDITYDPTRVAVADLLGSIRRLKYEPAVVERPSTTKQGVATRVDVDVAELPPELARLFAEARKSRKSVLVHFSGPG